VQVQMFWSSKRRRTAGAGGWPWLVALTACGEAQTTPTASSLTLVARGPAGFGATLAAGGAVGGGSVWGAMAASAAAESREVQACEVDLDTDAPASGDCREQCKGRACPLQADRFVHLWHPVSPQEEHCFATGVEPDDGIQLRCAEGELNLPLPPALTVSGSSVQRWRFGVDPGISPVLAVAAPAEERAWFYPAETGSPVELVVNPLPGGFAQDVAVLRMGRDRFNSRLIAVSAEQAGQVWFFRSGFPTPEVALRIGCLGDRPGFGRQLASGDVDGDGLTDLLVADADFVTVFSGTALGMVFEQSGTSACSFASLPEDAILASMSCASGGLTSGCSDAEFGASIAVADLDGDSDGEVLIGAPRMTVGGEQRGAILVYDAEGDDAHALTETVTSDQLPNGALLGSTLAVMQARDTDVVVTGAPGMGAVFMAACFSTTPAELRPAHCGGT
jgi:FG-GAP repeat